MILAFFLQVPVLLCAISCAYIHGHAQLSLAVDLTAPSLDGVLLDTIVMLLFTYL
jgi:hypothetical protein